MARPWRPALSDWLRTHNGVVDRPTLLRLGASDRTIKNMLAERELRPLQPGVYVCRSVQVGPLQKMTAICLRNPAAVISFVTAGRLLGLRGMSGPTIHVLVPHGCSPVMRGVVVHRCRDVADSDVIVRDDGIRLTTVARTLFDSSHLLPLDATASALEQALDKGWTSLDEMVALTERLARWRRPGSRQMRTVILGRPAWRSAVQSDLEFRVLSALQRAGLGDPRTQFPLTLRDGSEIRLDFAWPLVLLALEVDHPYWHNYSGGVGRDKRRDRKAATLGWQTIRVEPRDFANGFEDVIADLREILDKRAA